MSQWGKGAVWVNGKSLGRFWNIGPQQTLYLPAPWLKEGEYRKLTDAELNELYDQIKDSSNETVI